MYKLEYEDFVDKAKSLYHGGMLRYGQLIEGEFNSLFSKQAAVLPLIQGVLDKAQERFEEEMGWTDE